MNEIKEKLLNIQFARNVWAERRLCRLSPGNNIARFKECLEIEDSDKQFGVMEDIIMIMHEAYEVQMKYSDQNYEPFEINHEMMDILLNEDEFMGLVQRALAVFDSDGEVSVMAEPKGKKKEQTKFT